MKPISITPRAAKRDKLAQIGYEWRNDSGRPREGPPLLPRRQGNVKDQNHLQHSSASGFMALY